MSGVPVPIAVRAEQRRPPLPEADLPGEVVRRDPCNADAEPVDAVQVVCRADGNAVVASVLTAARSVEHVMIVQARPRSAGRNGASPAVAREDRVAMAGPALPLGGHVAKQAPETHPTRSARRREGANGRPPPRPDRTRTRGPDPPGTAPHLPP